MKIIKKINNNVAVGLDRNQKEVVVFGKGIGFPTIPYQLDDLSKIARTFYDVSDQYHQLFCEVDLDLVNCIGDMIEVVKIDLKGNWGNHVTFAIIDHINFCIQRMNSGFRVGFPYSYEIEIEFPEINRYAAWIVNTVNKRFNIILEKGEISCIAMHLLSSREGMYSLETETKAQRYTRILNEVTRIIEDFFGIDIDRKNLNFYRFRYHIQYFVRRKEAGEITQQQEDVMLIALKETYPRTYDCVLLIGQYLEREFSELCSKEELLYLMIHINRFYSIEDCNRKGITP